MAQHSFKGGVDARLKIVRRRRRAFVDFVPLAVGKSTEAVLTDYVPERDLATLAAATVVSLPSGNRVVVQI